MIRALVAALLCIVVLSPLPVMARGGGGHGAGGHCGGAHGGHGGMSHGGSFHGGAFFGGVRHGCFSHCVGFVRFGGGGYWGGDDYWGYYLDRISPTPGRENGASEALDAEPDEQAPKAPLSPQEEAQYRYDYRINDE